MAERNQTTRLISDSWDQVQLTEPVEGGILAGRSVVQKVQSEYLEDHALTRNRRRGLLSRAALHRSAPLCRRLGAEVDLNGTLTLGIGIELKRRDGRKEITLRLEKH